MGLAGPKNRSKLSHDPNNTTWSRSTARFGHKILTRHGWTPGDYLGAKDANHSSHYTAANASHIRVVLRDDNLGIGAKRGRETADNFGLNQFQGLLGRLNGKSDAELKKEEGTRRDKELALYQGQRWGFTNFVSGGFLVGDKIERISKREFLEVTPKAQVQTESGAVDTSTISKKRKRPSVEDSKDSVKMEKLEEGGLELSIDERGQIVGSTDSDTVPAQLSGYTLDEKAEKKKRKLEKRARKEEKRRRKEEKKRRKAKAEKSSSDSSEVRSRKGKKNKQQEERTEEKGVSNTASDISAVTQRTATSQQSLTLNFSNGRQVVRQRYIQQKRMASIDPKALKEIFMIKA
ncbi:hypothetical protein M501DRAFT_1005663 [Patellaria atrata CBS 101060]|uniref:PinX1-related protein 1 n=1 Tax=Patellaria atrata CBS 101060 TaxID=1346257 RepID=A0A9P4SI67_9PEZI|nr:hypothetical protein M501DRAFT_1005663 [Patellaria atrata CBS 101060]